MTMVEAAMVFPMVILSAVALMSMMLFFYRQVEAQCRLDIAARRTAGELTETVYCTGKWYPGYSVEKDGRNKVSGAKTVFFTEQGLLENTAADLHVQAYLVECGAWIRKWDMLEAAQQVAQDEGK